MSPVPIKVLRDSKVCSNYCTKPLPPFFKTFALDVSLSAMMGRNERAKTWWSSYLVDLLPLFTVRT